MVDSARSAAVPAFDTSVWRVLGNPLIGSESGCETGAPLHGLTVAVKDLYDVAGFAVGAGIPEYLREQSVATESAPALRSLLGAGASVRGIAQTDEFAYSIAGANVHYGTPPNPRVPAGLPGGSSSGPAAAVALGHADIGLGTDTAGSIRVPASYQGLWGLRSTQDAVNRSGLLPLAPRFDAVGWLTRSPVVLRAAVDASVESHLQRIAPQKYVVAASVVFGLEDDVQAAFLGTASRLPVDLVDVGDIAALFRAFRTVQAAEAWQIHGGWVRAHPGVLGPDVAARFAWASQVTGSADRAARGVLGVARERLDHILNDRVLLLPSTTSTAPHRDNDPARLDRTRSSTLALTCLAAIGGYPALSAPLLSVGRAPLGLCLVGPRFSDLALVDAASDLAGVLS
ncbi:amidase family protein [Cryobacterium sp. PH31-L1]|uniref:amidase family protein n=1 Tax=Cryobacterium sp. PH31-L1 TaxID=3046199 RepID=UPI0024BB35E7|nr:amidase family protein [Cryobacterium sp. PH31-L1]MDJ0378170.1 amidase family protein [Cryobacterium sp. PH31-L1]